MSSLKGGAHAANHPEVTGGCTTARRLSRKNQRAARPRMSVNRISIATVLWPPTGMMMSA